MLRYTISLLLLLCTLNAVAQDDEDSVAVMPDASVWDTLHQVRFGVDISKPIMNAISGGKYAFEAQADYYYKKDLYFAAEAGFGGGDVADTMLNYKTSNPYVRLGIDKSMLARLMPGDWDLAFIGLRYAVAFVNRSAATYSTYDIYWGQTSGTIAATNFTSHWFELVGGTKLDVYKGIYIGWTARGKFRLNQGPFKELPPAYVAGYGKGDKNSVFDFNFYVSYAMKWRKAKPKEPQK